MYIIYYYLIASFLAVAASLSLKRRVKSSYISTLIWDVYRDNRKLYIHVNLSHEYNYILG